MVLALTSANGYIGAHMLLGLIDQDMPVFPFASASINNDPTLQILEWQKPELLADIFKAANITEIIHITGNQGLVHDSLDDPYTYYNNNLVQAINLMRAAQLAGIERVVLSSSASVYGRPENIPIMENSFKKPISPYGNSILMVEQMMKDMARAHDINLGILRYFNVAGSDPKGRLGDMGKPSHLIRVAAQIAIGQRQEKLQIFGHDYETPDGTAIRDYIHISDVVSAHIMALQHMRDHSENFTINCGYGVGYSVLEVIQAFENVTGEKMPVEIAPRRAGDPPILIADNGRIRSLLNWKPIYDNLDVIVRNVLEWERKFAGASVAA